MNITLTEMQGIFRKEDIEGYIEIHGAPENEYDPEAEAFVDALQKLAPHEMTFENLMPILTGIWGKMFDLAPDDLQKRMPGFENIVQKVLAGHIA